MAVPNTSTFSLQDVVNEINPKDRSLNGCFVASTSTGFVTSYQGAKDRLSNFRGYSRFGVIYAY
jgi:hypothetical protein